MEHRLDGHREHFFFALADHLDVRRHAGAQLAPLRVEADFDVEDAHFVVDAHRGRDAIDAAGKRDFRIRVERDFHRHSDVHLADVHFIHARFHDHFRDVSDREEHCSGIE